MFLNFLLLLADLKHVETELRNEIDRTRQAKEQATQLLIKREQELLSALQSAKTFGETESNRLNHELNELRQNADQEQQNLINNYKYMLKNLEKQFENDKNECENKVK